MRSPGNRRLLAATIAAAFGAVSTIALPFLVVDSYAGLFIVAAAYVFGLPIAAVHLLILALPAYVLLSDRLPFRWWHALLGGFVVGALPAGVLTGIWAVTRTSARAAYAEGGLAELASELAPMGMLGLAGAVGGLAFWLVLRPWAASDAVE